MNENIKSLLDLSVPLPSSIFVTRANCFNAVQLYWQDAVDPNYTGPQDFIDYLGKKFDQVSAIEVKCSYIVEVVWSRSSDFLQLGSINISALVRKDPGYPFGLVVEHAFVSVDSQRVFQKRDPSKFGPYEVISRDQALKPYLAIKGFEVTYHRRKA